MWKSTTQQRSAQKKYPSIVTFGELYHFQYVTKVLLVLTVVTTRDRWEPTGRKLRFYVLVGTSESRDPWLKNFL
jgi:hypothetical protein